MYVYLEEKVNRDTKVENGDKLIKAITENTEGDESIVSDRKDRKDMVSEI